jgi:uncharacterized ion transporter superfamily protein YfcC
MVRIRLPHPLILLLSSVAVAVALTWILPAGVYQRRIDQATNREVVVPGTYAQVPSTPVGLMGALLAVPRGIVAGADVILTILFVGGTFALIEGTGAMARLVGALVGRTRRRWLMASLVALGFATLGALENMHEEIVALVPVLLVLSRGLGFGAITALGLSVGAAVVGAAFGPTNPFQTGVALKVAGLPAMSQAPLRFGLLAVAVGVWIGWTLYASSRDDVRPRGAASASSFGQATARDAWLLAIAVTSFVPYVYGVVAREWGFNELSALFLPAGLLAGLVSGRSLSDSAAAFLKAMESMLAASLFVGVARGISVALGDGQVLDTILYGLATPLSSLPGEAAAILMVPMHAALHVLVPSVSGQAVLTMPIIAPLADLVGVSRDAAVLAFQTGAGLMDMITPTNGALLAMLLSAGVPYGRWLRFAVPGALWVGAVGLAGLLLAG